MDTYLLKKIGNLYIRPRESDKYPDMERFFYIYFDGDESDFLATIRFNRERVGETSFFGSFIITSFNNSQSFYSTAYLSELINLIHKLQDYFLVPNEKDCVERWNLLP